MRAPSGTDVRRFLSELGRSNRATAVRAAADGVVVAITLKKRGVRPLLGPAPTGATLCDPERSRAVAAAVDAGLAIVPMASTCLRRSVTLLRELRRLRLDSAMHIGVRTVDGRVEAHAWVQSGDFVVNDDVTETQTYTELAAGDVENLLPLLT